MEEAWHAHVGALTLKELQSPEACRKHLEGFARSIVSQGLEQTPLGSNNDIQEVITTFLRESQHMEDVPPAQSMEVITVMSKRFQIGVMLKELNQIVRAAAEDGRRSTGWLDPREHSPFPGSSLKSRKSFTSDPFWLIELFDILEDQGYGIDEEHERSRKTGRFMISW